MTVNKNDCAYCSHSFVCSRRNDFLEQAEKIKEMAYNIDEHRTSPIKLKIDCIYFDWATGKEV